ncbi:MAG: hypothetical protein R2851_17225 [Caldilineaceae bacterium]
MVDYLRIPPDARLDSVRRRLGQANADHVALVVPDGWINWLIWRACACSSGRPKSRALS